TSGHEGYGRWSPDGKSVAFTDDGDLANIGSTGLARLMVQPFEGGSATKLVEQVEICCALPAWSPDGTRIYFAKMGSVYSVSRAGGQPELVLAGTRFFDLSPDGRALAVWRAVKSADGGIRGSVWISSPPGAEPREFLPAPFAVQADLGPVFLR